jgi:signal transduction histidine kinase
VATEKNSTRSSFAGRAGLHGACALPIRHGQEMVGVIELFSRQIQRLDPHMLQALASVGLQIGQFIERKRAEETLKQTLAELQASHAELKATQLELIQAAKLESIGTLAAGVAHEVKNPLQTILMGLSFVSNSLPAAKPELAEALSDMRDAVQRADSIVRELLQLSAATKLELKAEDLNEVIERALWLMNHELVAAGITVVRELGADLPRVRLDKIKLEQVFINLFINAVQAMSQGGKLTVRTRMERWPDSAPPKDTATGQIKPGDLVVVAEVQDTGVGIPEEDLAKLFDPFFTTKAPGVGTGLGLSVIKKIVDLHGAAITVKNAPPGGVLVTLIVKVT